MKYREQISFYFHPLFQSINNSYCYYSGLHYTEVLSKLLGERDVSIFLPFAYAKFVNVSWKSSSNTLCLSENSSGQGENHHKSHGIFSHLYHFFLYYTALLWLALPIPDLSFFFFFNIFHSSVFLLLYSIFLYLYSFIFHFSFLICQLHWKAFCCLFLLPAIFFLSWLTAHHSALNAVCLCH